MVATIGTCLKYLLWPFQRREKRLILERGSSSPPWLMAICDKPASTTIAKRAGRAAVGSFALVRPNKWRFRPSATISILGAELTALYTSEVLWLSENFRPSSNTYGGWLMLPATIPQRT